MHIIYECVCLCVCVCVHFTKQSVFLLCYIQYIHDCIHTNIEHVNHTFYTGIAKQEQMVRYIKNAINMNKEIA